MQKIKGFTLIELLIVVAFIGIIASVVGGIFLNNKSSVEKRAFTNANLFVTTNNITVKRLSCTGETNNDGFSTCTLVTAEDEKIQLDCTSDWVSVNIWRATGCKEKSLIQFSQ